MTVEDIEIAIAEHYEIRRHLIVTNVSWGLGIHECDVLIMSESGYLTEVEIKLTVADLKRDFKKKHNHVDDRIKEMYYAMPHNIVNEKVCSIIPEKCGIIKIYKYGCVVERNAMVNHNIEPLSSEDKFKLARLGTMRIWNLKKRLQKIREAVK